MEQEEETPLSPIAAALASAIVVEHDCLAISETALEAARTSLRQGVTEDELVDIAALRVRVERLTGERGEAVCNALDDLLESGISLAEADASSIEHSRADEQVELLGQERKLRAPSNPQANTHATPHLTRGLRTPRTPSGSG